MAQTESPSDSPLLSLVPPLPPPAPLAALIGVASNSTLREFLSPLAGDGDVDEEEEAAVAKTRAECKAKKIAEKTAGEEEDAKAAKTAKKGFDSVAT